MKKNNKGFTLVELIVVLVILAILAAILVPTLLGYIDRARSEKDFSTAQTVRVAAQAAIDQAYGSDKLADGTKPASLTISTMTGTIKGVAADATSTEDAKEFVKLTYTLSGVDTAKVTGFGFYYEAGIIKKGYVLINGHYYELTTDGSWKTATSEPSLS